MSYTTGGQTIDKSMNGIITIDSGNGVIIEGDTITTPRLAVTTATTLAGATTISSATAITGLTTFNVSLPTTTLTTSATANQFINRTIANLFYGQLATAVTNTWLSTNEFNAVLPTSTLTGTPTATQIAPVSMLSNLYQAIVTGGFARLTTVNNAFTNNNTFVNLPSTTTTFTTATANQFITKNIADNLYAVTGGFARLTTVDNAFTNNNTFNSNLPTSTLTGTPTSTQIAPLAMLSNVLAPLASPTFTGTVKIKNPDTTTTTTPALTIENSETTPSVIKFLLNSTAVSPNLTAGDDAIYSNGVLNLTTTSASACNIRISATDVALTATTTTLNGTTNNIGGTNVNINSTGTLAISGSTATTFVNLPSTTTTLTTATANQFITKNIGDALYSGAVTGGFARLTTANNTFTNINNFNGAQTIMKTPSVIPSTSPILGIITSVATSPYLNFYADVANTSLFNPCVTTGDAVISGGGGGGTKFFTLINGDSPIATILGISLGAFANYICGLTYFYQGEARFNDILPTSTITTSTGTTQLINRAIGNTYYGQLATANTWTSANTFNQPITVGYTTVPTFTDKQIGYQFSSKPPTNNNGPTANTIYTLHAFAIPSAGSWKVDAYVLINQALNGRFDLSIGTSATHEFEKVSAYAFQNNTQLPFSMMNSVMGYYATGTVINVKISSTQAQSPLPLSTYSSIYVMTRVG